MLPRALVGRLAADGGLALVDRADPLQSLEGDRRAGRGMNGEELPPRVDHPNAVGFVRVAMRVLFAAHGPASPRRPGISRQADDVSNWKPHRGDTRPHLDDDCDAARTARLDGVDAQARLLLTLERIANGQTNKDLDVLLPQ